MTALLGTPFPPASPRVESSTTAAINARILRETRANVARAAAGGPDAIARRLEELEREWDIERVPEANASTLMRGSGSARW